MLRIPFFASFSGPDLGRWIAAGVVAGASWLADSIAAAGGAERATLAVPWSSVALFAVSLAVVASAMAVRSRVRRRRVVERELEAQLQLGMNAAQRRASLRPLRPRPLLVPRVPTLRPPPEPAPRFEPLPPTQPVTEQTFEPEVAPDAPARHREVFRSAESEPVEAQAVLLDRIVKDAWGLALGGGVLPPKAAPRSEPRPSPPPAPDPVVLTPKQTIEAPPRPCAREAELEQRPSAAPAPPSPRVEENPPESQVTVRMPAPSPMRLLASGLPASRPAPVPADPLASPDGFESALAEAWGHAIQDEAAPAPPARPRTAVVAPQAPLSRFAHPLRATGVATSVNEYLRLCESLLAKDRGDEATRLAREGLALHPGESLILSVLSRAEERAGRLDAALAAAVAAHRARPSRTSLTEVLRIAAAARRFRPEDGERLRRAVERRPSEPVLLRAAGVFEAMHGNRWAAIGLLRTALGLESDEAIRGQIASELSRLEASASGDGA